jgi:hypothetical protein
MTPATKQKRAELLLFVERVLAPEPAVQGVVGIGSIANGRMRPDSDIDAVIFLEPFDWYIIPGEFIWRPSDDTYHSIFTADASAVCDGLELDCLRLDFRQWTSSDFEWPEGRKAELSQGWLAFDRRDRVRRLVARRTEYPEALRQQRLDEAVIWLDQHLGDGGPELRWQSLGPVIALDRLAAAYDYLVAALFAYNRSWRPWRNRQMDSLLMLPWLPAGFEARVLQAANGAGFDDQAYLAQAEALTGLFQALLERLTADGFYHDDPVDQAFIRAHDQPGFAWNMDEWNTMREHREAQALAATGANGRPRWGDMVE